MLGLARHERASASGKRLKALERPETGRLVRIELPAAAPSDVANPAVWIPVSHIVWRNGERTTFPHFQERYKPGIIAIDRRSRHFANEARSYHHFCQAWMKATPPDEPPLAWLIADHRALRRYGLGAVPPAPLPVTPWLRRGYLVAAGSLSALATKIEVPVDAMIETVAGYNRDAAAGEDYAFERGGDDYQRYIRDSDRMPNPCVGPLDRGPFYAVRIHVGDAGTLAGLSVDDCSRVLDDASMPIAGHYAVGNDQRAVLGGGYPGGGSTLGPAVVGAYLAALALAGDDFADAK